MNYDTWKSTEPREWDEERPMDVTEEPRDGESYDDAILRAMGERRDPAEDAAHDLIAAVGRFEIEIAKCSDVDRAHRLWRMLRSAEQNVERVAVVAGQKVDALSA